MVAIAVTILTMHTLTLACWGGFRLLASKIHVPIGYCFEARFDIVPADDKALKTWIQSQPGILSRTVRVGRFDPDKKLLVVDFTQVRNMTWEPPLPDLDAECRIFGYTRSDGPFRLCTDPSRDFH